MAKTELKTIPINKILANFTQPRERFDKEKTKELAESILSNSLINPITVRKYKGGRYMVVSGERRWQAHKIAGLKNIQAFVKAYKNEGQMMVESLIENVHRDNLNELEKGKYLTQIAKIENIIHKKTKDFKFGYKKGDIHFEVLAKRVSMPHQYVRELVDLAQSSLAKYVREKEISSGQARMIRRVKDEKIQERFVERAKKERKEDTVRAISLYNKATEDVKEALLSDEISVKQAENIGKIHSPKAREQALKQVKQHRQIAGRHEHIADITPKLKERAKPELTDAVKRQFDTAQRRIFTYLNDAKTSLSKVNNNLKQANMMLSQLMSKSFEYGLDKRTLITTMQQMKIISDRLNEFEIENDRFDDLKDSFLDRVEDRLDELK